MRPKNEMTLAELWAGRNEGEFQRDVLRTAAAQGWGPNYHTRLSIGSQRGFPDLVLVRARDRRLVFMELKGPKTLVQPEQQAWIDALRWCGQEAYIFRPRDEELVQDVLR